MASCDLENLTDSQIRQKIIEIEGQCGPITSATRKSYIKKLKKLLESSDASTILNSPDKYDPKNITHQNGQEADNQHQQTPTPSRKRQRTSMRNAVSSTTPQNCDEVQSSSPKKRSRIQRKKNVTDEVMDVESSFDAAESIPPSSSSFLSSSIIETDENQDFGNMIAKKLRKYDDLTKNIIQNEIMSVFIRADTGYYNQA